MALELDEQTRVRREKLQKMRDAGQAYPHFVEVKNSIDELLKHEAQTDPEKLKALGTYSIAGRVQFIRAFSKAGFLKIRERNGSLQI